MGDQDRSEWFLKQQLGQAGAKRKFDTIAYSEGSTNSRDYVSYEGDDWQPWRWFKRWGLLEGKDLRELEEEWRLLTEGPETQARMVRGEWCIPEFSGAKSGIESRAGQNQATSRFAAIHDAEQLTQLQQQGMALLDQFGNSYTPAPQNRPVGPATQASVSDQPQVMAPRDVMGLQIVREVTPISHDGNLPLTVGKSTASFFQVI